MFNGFLKQKQGFTLIEVVAVLAILGMMAIMLMPSLDIASNRAKDTKMVADLVTLDSAVKLYRMENGIYPAGLKDLKDDGYVLNKVYEAAEKEKIVYKLDGASYSLTGTKTNGAVIMADGTNVKKPE
ncbi:MAG: type II secretion system protein [Acidaminococcaceae bacterium]